MFPPKPGSFAEAASLVYLYGYGRLTKDVTVYFHTFIFKSEIQWGFTYLANLISALNN